MTLFAKATPAKAAPENQIFINALQKYFAGELDPLTISYLQQNSI